MFNLELSVTEKCNLGCPYCYVANKSSFMTEKVFDNVYNKLTDLMDRSGETQFHVSFFGGEPLLNWDLIKYATPILNADPRCHSLVLISNMTMIDEEKSSYLKDNNIGVSWSFDGMGSNESRPLLPMLENKDKDNKLYNGILDMYEDKKDIILSHTTSCKVMIWPGNTTTMTENFDFLIDYGIPNPDFCLVRDNVWSIDDLKTFYVELQRLADRYIAISKSGTYCSIGFFNLAIMDSVVGIISGKRAFGCFAGCNGAVATSKGDFYPCARFASKGLNIIDDEYSFSYWAKQFNPANYNKCDECQLKRVCNAGCSFSQLDNGNKPVDSVCELYHMIYEQALRIVSELKYVPSFVKMISDQIRDYNASMNECKG